MVIDVHILACLFVVFQCFCFISKTVPWRQGIKTTAFFSKLGYLQVLTGPEVVGNEQLPRFIYIYCFDFYNKIMEHQFYRFDTLQKGAKQMIDLIKEQYCDNDQPVQPKIQPGFLRNSLPVTAPEQGESLEYLLQRTKNAIAPGIVGWQSPKFFGFYPHSINVTSVLAEMYTTTFHSPSFSYATAPSYTELENIVIDWSTQALGLPEKFLIKNSGGGIINNSTSESVFVSAHAAKYKKMKELGIDATHPDILKFVGYFGEGSHLSSERALLVKDTPYRRSIPYKYNPEILNYELDYEYLVRVVEEDEQNGLIPFWCGLSWGNTFSAAIDVSQKAVNFCKEHNMWVNIDSAFLGSTWICEKFRPSQAILEAADSLQINFTMLLLNGTGGSLFFVADKKTLNESFGARKLSFSIFQNHYTQNHDVIDYKDWTIGLSRRNNALKIYYTFVHYGLKKLREALLLQEKKGQYAIQLIASYSHLFHVHAVQYVTVLFQLKDKSGKPSNKLTKLMAERVRNLKEGFTTPNAFQGSIFLRISAGNFHTTETHLKNYIEAIVEIALEVQQSNF